MNLRSTIPHYDLTVREKDRNSLDKVIKHITSDWNTSMVKYKTFNGTTNTLIGCYLDDIDDNTILIRLYGKNSELFLDRQKGLENFLLLNKYNFAPELLCTFENGFCYKYVVGKVLTVNDLRSKSMSVLCAKLLAKLHTVPVGNDVTSDLFPTIRKYLRLIPEKFMNDAQQDRFSKHIPTRDTLNNEVDYFEGLLDFHTHKDVVFCHNDISCENLVYNEKKDMLHCIDYEFSFPNYAGFDIGNLFDEFAGVNEVDYNLYPTIEFQKWWILIYLTEYKQLKDNSTEVTDTDVNDFFIEVNHFALISHLFWGIWAIMQAHHSDIKFDFLGYAIIRLSEYFRKKEQFLSYK